MIFSKHFIHSHTYMYMYQNMQGALCVYQQNTISNKLDIYILIYKNLLMHFMSMSLCNLLSIQQQCTNDTMETKW